MDCDVPTTMLLNVNPGEFAVIGRMYGETCFVTVAEGLSPKAADEAMQDARRKMGLDEIRKDTDRRHPRVEGPRPACHERGPLLTN